MSRPEIILLRHSWLSFAAHGKQTSIDGVNKAGVSSQLGINGQADEFGTTLAVFKEDHITMFSVTSLTD